MGTWTCIRTEKELGPHLSKIFQSFVNGPELDGEECELKQIESLIEQDLTPFTIRNYSGLWDENEFPADPLVREELISQQIEQDKVWNGLIEFLNLTELLITKTKSDFFSNGKLVHKEDWWNGYFGTDEENDSFIKDLEIIRSFLKKAKENGECKTAFYVD